jgi:hypothetical protein
VQKLEVLAHQFAEGVTEDTVSMAALQGFLMRHKHSPQDAAAGVATWVKSQLSGSSSSNGDASSKSLRTLQVAES